MGEAWLRPEAEAEGGRGTADGSLLLAGRGTHTRAERCRCWGRSEEVDLDPALRVGRVRRQPGRAAPGHRLAV